MATLQPTPSPQHIIILRVESGVGGHGKEVENKKRKEDNSIERGETMEIVELEDMISSETT
jgi:hypothetical protein